MSCGNLLARTRLREAGLLLLLSLCAALLSLWLHPRRPVLAWEKPFEEEVTLAEISRWESPVLWVDARTQEAYAQRHIGGAVLLNEQNWEALFPDLLKQWTPEQRLVVYCASGTCDASQAVARRLKADMGLKEIYVLKAGWTAWLRENP